MVVRQGDSRFDPTQAEGVWCPEDNVLVFYGRLVPTNIAT